MGKKKPEREEKEVKKAQKPTKKPKSGRGGVLRAVRRRIKMGRMSHTSIFFLLWTIFSSFSLLVVLFFGISQQVLGAQAYKDEAARQLATSGKQIYAAIKNGSPDSFGGNNSYFLQILEEEHDVRIHVLSEEGRVIFPIAPPTVDTEDPALKDLFDYSEEMKKMRVEINNNGGGETIYEADGKYVYGSRILLYEEGRPVYLYVEKSFLLAETAASHMGVRLILVSVFAIVLSFAASSVVSGWVTKPLTEMTKKTRRLANGDFEVDFHGSDYGQEMVELAETLNYARDELSKTDRMQKELIANVSHDFKTPLTMIKAYASMIIEISGDVPEKRNKHAQVIVDEADRLASLVNDVLDLSKMQSGLTELKTERVNMSALTNEALERFAYLKEEKGYRFETDVEEGLYALVDKLHIGQVLYNLIGNAVNYTGEDKTVFVSLKREDGGFRFSVRDTGVGIKPEDLNEIWDRYYRSSETHKRPVRGTGLGLSIVKTVLQRHNLRFGVDSEVGKGSTFYVLFPIAEETKE